VRSMDEERRSLAELHILKGRIRKLWPFHNAERF
jgi:hypothetical protein